MTRRLLAEAGFLGRAGVVILVRDGVFGHGLVGELRRALARLARLAAAAATAAAAAAGAAALRRARHAALRRRGSPCASFGVSCLRCLGAGFGGFALGFDVGLGFGLGVELRLRPSSIARA